MELIIKPTNRCNFACTFCSSNKISNAIFNLQFLKKYLIQNFVSTIIVNGGDPLMMDPQFYEELINFVEQHKLDTTISLTTNLWDFYINPQKWKDIFNNYRIGITTSFQYGPGRYLASGQPYTEQLFLKVQDKFFKYCNYNVDFISVITDQNQQYALDNVLLAKKLNVECKLNGAVASGRQTKMYNLHKLYNIYLAILKNNLTDWEYNTKNLINHFKNLHTTCPLTNQTCKDNIRCMQANMNITMCPALDDDNIKDSTIYRNYKQQCYICQYYMICNGCMKRIKDLKEEKPDCTQLKKILSEFKSICLNI